MPHLASKVFLMELVDEETLSNLRALSAIPAAAVSKYLECGFFSWVDGTLVLDEDKVIPLAQNLSSDPETLRRALGAGFSLTANAMEQGDDFEAIVKDAVAAGRVDADQMSDLANKLLVIQGILRHEGVVKTKKQSRAVSTVLPRLEYANARAVAIPIYDKQFSPEYQNVEDYNARVVDIAHFVVLQMDVDQFGTTKRFSVGLSERQVDFLVAKLQAARRQAREMHARIGRIGEADTNEQ
jgi:hypothetical protein